MPYTNVAKPSSSVYTRVNVKGATLYDQSDIEYDDSIVAYDGGSDASYTNISKPTGSVYTAIAKPT